MRDPNIGLLGTGVLGCHLGQLVRDHPRAELTAIADVSETNLADAGEELDLGGESRYPDHESMFAREDLDAVVIVTPHHVHHEQIVDAFERGIDVLCEKPLVTDLEDALDLRRRADRSDRILMPGYQRHLEPAFVYAHDQFAAGDNDPTYVTAEVAEDWIQRYDRTWRVDRSLSGGGYLCDTGSHLVDAILWTTDLRPSSVRATMQFHDEDGIDVRGQLTIECDAGEQINISLPGNVSRLSEFVHVWDDRGSLLIDGRHWETYEVTRIDPDGVERTPTLDEHDHDSVHARKVAAFVESIDTRREPPATVDDAVRVAAVRDAAYESAHTGEPVAIDADLG